MTDEFHEYKFVQQQEGEPSRQIFFSDYFELWTWMDDFGAFVQVQLTYDRGFDEHAVTWWDSKGKVTHHAIDDENRSGAYSPTPLLVSAKRPLKPEVAARFGRDSGNLPPALRSFVLEMLAKVEVQGEHSACDVSKG